MDITQLQKILKEEPSYRSGQVKKLLFRDLIEDWSEATTLPLTLRERLNKECPFKINAKILVSRDGKTAKALFILKDNLRIEAVLMRHQDERITLCLSSQVGCPLGCAFCATGKTGLRRNLDYFEIVEQFLFFARYSKKMGLKPTNVVFMGMGEPFLNYDNVMEAIKILNDKDGFNLGARRFSISTCGIIEGIEKLAREPLQINLAISLHAAEDELRSKIMPINKKYPIRKILEAVDNYIKKTHRKVMFEYLMIKNLNDGEAQAKKLAKLLKKPLYFVNLISYNPTGEFVPSPPERIKIFGEILEKGGVSVTRRWRFGQDIKAACGQLASEN